MRQDVVVIGLLAHVDAGKTTLSEALLYRSGTIKKAGRVDHNDAVLDYDDLERQRGITIYAKEARFNHGDKTIILEDTPGHIDFSLEMQRVLPILDYAILLVDATSGIMPYTRRLWSLLTERKIPTIIFLNKIDLSFDTPDKLMVNIKEELKVDLIDFTDIEKAKEDVAGLDEELIETYLSTGDIDTEAMYTLFSKRLYFPIIIGSALKGEGIDALLKTIDILARPKVWPDELKAYVYRIKTDKRGNQLNYLKITGGTLKVKDKLKDEKVDEIRLYSGTTYKAVKEVSAGDLAVVVGPSDLLVATNINDDIREVNSIKPYFRYRIIPDNGDVIKLYNSLLKLAKTDPSLAIKKKDDEITLSLMGQVQMEVIKAYLLADYGISAHFGTPLIDYHETVLSESYGIGHYEPIGHYSEVHLRLRPANKKTITNPNKLKTRACDTVKEYLEGKDFAGVLIGNPVDKVEIAIMAIKTSLDHTSNDDLRRATDFALRNALLNNECAILEPYEDYRIVVDSNDSSSIIYLLDKLQVAYEVSGDTKTTIKGKISIRDLTALMDKDSIRRKNIFIEHSFCGYDTAKNQDNIIQEFAYDPYNDPDNLSGSIFFKNGAGYYVSNHEVFDLAHIKPLIRETTGSSYTYNRLKISDQEAKHIFENTSPKRANEYKPRPKVDTDYKRKSPKRDPLYLVDGYNLLYLAKEEGLYDNAERLIDDLISYQRSKGVPMWVIFDAYKVNHPSIKGDDFKIIYTKQGETADEYIQRTVRDLSSKYSITVITSDHLIQIAVFSYGAYRRSSRTFLQELKGKYKFQPQSLPAFRPLEGLLDEDEEE